MRHTLAALLLIGFLSSCRTDPYPYELQQFSVPDGGYKCLVIGDWGLDGNVIELANAHFMDQLACIYQIDAVLTTGDNFYEYGVDGIDDPHWRNSFEDVFNGSCILPLSWWPTLGNHDVRGSVDAQIQYSSVSSRWNLPSAYYDRWVTTPDSVTVHFVTIDTSPFINGYYANPESSAMADHLAQADTSLQLQWLDSVLAAGHPDWLVVKGHHPVYAASGHHGSTQELIDKLVPRFEAYGVDAYFCGHNHSLEVSKASGKTLYITSGAGSKVQSSIQNEWYNLFAEARPGFVLATFAEDSMQIDVMGEEGQRLFSHVSPQTP